MTPKKIFISLSSKSVLQNYELHVQNMWQHVLRLYSQIILIRTPNLFVCNSKSENFAFSQSKTDGSFGVSLSFSRLIDGEQFFTRQIVCAGSTKYPLIHSLTRSAIVTHTKL